MILEIFEIRYRGRTEQHEMKKKHDLTHSAPRINKPLSCKIFRNT